MSIMDYSIETFVSQESIIEYVCLKQYSPYDDKKINKEHSFEDFILMKGYVTNTPQFANMSYILDTKTNNLKCSSSLSKMNVDIAINLTRLNTYPEIIIVSLHTNNYNYIFKLIAKHIFDAYDKQRSETYQLYYYINKRNTILGTFITSRIKYGRDGIIKNNVIVNIKTKEVINIENKKTLFRCDIISDFIDIPNTFSKSVVSVENTNLYISYNKLCEFENAYVEVCKLKLVEIRNKFNTNNNYRCVAFSDKYTKKYESTIEYIETINNTMVCSHTNYISALLCNPVFDYVETNNKECFSVTFTIIDIRHRFIDESDVDHTYVRKTISNKLTFNMRINELDTIDIDDICITNVIQDLLFTDNVQCVIFNENIFKETFKNLIYDKFN